MVMVKGEIYRLVSREAWSNNRRLDRGRKLLSRFVIVDLFIHTHPMRFMLSELPWFLSPLEVLNDILGQILFYYLEVYLRFEAKLLQCININGFILDVARVGAKRKAAEGLIQEGSLHNIDFCEI